MTLTIWVKHWNGQLQDDERDGDWFARKFSSLKLGDRAEKNGAGREYDHCDNDIVVSARSSFDHRAANDCMRGDS